VGRLRLSTRAATVKVRGGTASARLGGVSIYSESARSLQEDLKLLGDEIVVQSAILPSIERKALRYLVCKKLGEEIEDRLFGAVLGSQMRMGHIDSIGCAADSGKVFRVLINAERLEVFQQRLIEVRLLLRKRNELRISEVRDLYSPGGEWGTWSAAKHLLSRLTQIGCAVYVDRYTFAWPKGLEGAFG
jgi:hypothetical protein